MRILTDISVDWALAGKGHGRFAEPLSLELAFTRTYQRYEHDDPAVREIECLKVMFPAILQPIEEGDLLAGRIVYPMVGFSPEPMGLGYYCRESDIRLAIERVSLTPPRRREVEQMLGFWRTRTTHAQVRRRYSDAIRTTLPSDNWTEDSGIAFPLYRMAGTVLDYGKLVTLGVPGLRREIERHGSTPLFTGMLAALDLLCACCQHYADAAERRSQPKLAAVLRALPQRAPQSLHEAMQLMWLHALMSGTWNYGRMDAYLGQFLVGESDETALELLKSLWRLMAAYSNQYNNRVFVGGLGRSNQALADRFALLAIEATRALRLNQPQLSMRCYRGMAPALMDRAMTALGEGCTFPILYNDDVNVPAVAKAFGVPEAEAVHYTPYGCGEYVLEHRSVGTPNGVINLTKCLEVTLHNGVDPQTGRPHGLATGDPDSFTSFEDLWTAYGRQVEHHMKALAEQEKLTYKASGEAAPFLLLSVLYDDCIKRGKGIFQGGVRYLGGTIETYGNTNAADSLTAIDELVYRQRKLTLRQVIDACAAGFGPSHEPIRRLLQQAPKYGNDNGAADAMAARLHEAVCRLASAQAARVGLDSYLVVIINNWANTILGRRTGASPDGRAAGEPLANGNNPSPGSDRSGVTAFLNSLVKLDPSIHAGAVQNMKFSRELFTGQRRTLEHLLDSYFAAGGTQAMITVVSPDDLRAAMREPQNWGHLIVRVGGFSSRFTDLPVEVQREVLQRTLHG